MSGFAGLDQFAVCALPDLVQCQYPQCDCYLRCHWLADCAGGDTGVFVQWLGASRVAGTHTGFHLLACGCRDFTGQLFYDPVWGTSGAFTADTDIEERLCGVVGAVEPEDAAFGVVG